VKRPALHLWILFALFLTPPAWGFSSFEPWPGEESTLCKLRLEVIGDVEFFWLWGRDAWSGRGSVLCYEGERQILASPVKLRLETWGPGLGVNADSIIDLGLRDFPMSRMAQLYGTFATSGDGRMGEALILLAQRNHLKWRFLATVKSQVLTNDKPLTRSGHLTVERDLGDAGGK
jgi:hypothetical protein